MNRTLATLPAVLAAALTLTLGACEQQATTNETPPTRETDPSRQPEEARPMTAPTAQIADRIKANDWSVLDDPSAVTPDHAPAIATVLETGDDQTRELAVLALEKAGGAEAKATLYKSLDDEADMVRAAAARAVRSGATTDDLGELSIRISHRDPYVREQVALTLGDLGEPNAVQWIRQRHAEEDRDAPRHAQSLALAKLGDNEHRKLYLDRLEAESPRAVVKALEDYRYLRDERMLPKVAATLSDERDAIDVGPSHGKLVIRVCDVAVNVLDDVLAHPFDFEVNGAKRYKGTELAEAKQKSRR